MRSSHSSAQHRRRTRYTDGIAQKVIVRERDPGKWLAASLIKRALRHAGLRAVLHGSSGAVGFIVPHSQDLSLFRDAGQSLLLSLAKNRDFDALFIDDTDRNQAEAVSRWDNPRWDDATAARMLAKSSRLFLFATAEDDFPPFLKLAADAVVSLGGCDGRLLRGVLHAMFGRAPTRDLPDTQALPLITIAAALRSRSSLSLALARLDRVTRKDHGPLPVPTPPARDPRAAPSLDDLHGLGEAAEWGYELATDFSAYRNREIAFADMSQGVVLYGPSGTGKTMAAQAIAHTCGVPILIHSLARWQAMGHLGDLLKAMRKAFDEARKKAPCILFIDEIDSFGDRAQSDPRWEQYQREVINGFLECLDGAEGREGVVVIGATNLADKIDPAILRPGRLERVITIPLPDAQGRASILRYHLGSTLSEMDLMPLAQRLEGLSGAHLEKIVRDGKRRARRERRELALTDLELAMPELIRLSPDAYRRACLHEAAHVLVGCLVLKHTDNPPVGARVYREAPPGLPAGETAFLRPSAVPLTKSAYLGDITMWLAGLAAEDLFLGEHCDGCGGRPGSDLHRATVQALALEASVGMGKQLIYRGGVGDANLLSLLRADMELCERVEKILKACRTRAQKLLARHRTALDAMTELLERQGHLTLENIASVLNSYRAQTAVQERPASPSKSNLKPRRKRANAAANPNASAPSDVLENSHEHLRDPLISGGIKYA